MTPGPVPERLVPGGALDALRAALADRYRLERELGRGGMATVHLARDLRHDRDVAIKVIRPELASALGGERFVSEIRLTARLQHPHILALHDSCQDASCLYYVMPLVDGESLRGRLEREGTLTVDEALRLGAEVADALAYAHGRGVVHRDLKPENILLQAGHALVADFGIALALDRSADATRFTATGFAIGTPAYMSPEQAFADPALDGRSDVYSLGVVLYEALTGRMPREATSPSAFLAAFAAPVAPASTLRRAVPAALDALLQRMLADEPAHRPDAAAAAAELDRLRRTAAGAGATTVVVAAAPPAERDGVAVLGFRNLGRDPSVEWLGAGIAETLTSGLRRTRRVRVVPPERVQQVLQAGAAADVTARLGARYAIVGSYQAAGERLRITARIEDTANGEVVADLGEDGTHAQLFELQDRLLAGVLEGLGESAPAATPAVPAPPPPSLDVYECYARGRQDFHGFSPASLQRATGHFIRALELDPDFAPAHAALGSCCMFRHIGSGDPADLDAALAHFERAAALDPGLPEVQVRLAYLYSRRRRFAEARDAADRGVAAEPDNDEAWYFRGTRTVIAGSFGAESDWEAGCADLLRALELNPDAQVAAMVASWACRVRGDLRAAAALATHAGRIERGELRPALLARWVGSDTLLACVRLDEGRAREAIDLAERDATVIAAREHLYRPSFLAQARLVMGEAALRLGDAARSLQEFGAALAIANEQPGKGGMGWVRVRALAGRARALASVRLRRDAAKELAAAETLVEDHPEAGFEWAWTASAPDAVADVAAAHACLGAPDAALEWLARAARTGWADVPALRGDPSFAPLLADPSRSARLEALVAPSPCTPALEARLARLAAPQRLPGA